MLMDKLGLDVLLEQTSLLPSSSPDIEDTKPADKVVEEKVQEKVQLEDVTITDMGSEVSQLCNPLMIVLD